MLNIEKLTTSNRAKLFAISNALNYYNTSIVREYDVNAHNVYFNASKRLYLVDLETALCSMRKNNSEHSDVSKVLDIQIYFYHTLCNMINTYDEYDMNVTAHNNFNEIIDKITSFEYDREKIFTDLLDNRF